MVDGSAVQYQVIAKAFGDDREPEIQIFETMHEAQQWVEEEVDCRVSWRVTHPPYMVNEDDIAEIEEEEASCIEITQI